MGKPTARSCFLSCFGSGLAGPASRTCSEVAVSKNEVEPTIGSYISPDCCQAAAIDSASLTETSISSAACGRPTSNSARRPSYAFVQPPIPTLDNDTASGQTPAGDFPIPLAAPSDASQSPTEEFPPCLRPRVRKPRIRTSRVSPAYDTQNEVSPATASAFGSLSTSSDGSPGDVSQSGTALSFPRPHEEKEEETLRRADGGADADFATETPQLNGCTDGTSNTGGYLDNTAALIGTRAAFLKSSSLDSLVSAAVMPAAVVAAVGLPSLDRAQGSEPGSSVSCPVTVSALTATGLISREVTSGICSRGTSACACSDSGVRGSNGGEGRMGASRSGGVIVEGRGSGSQDLILRGTDNSGTDAATTVVIPGLLYDNDEDGMNSTVSIAGRPSSSAGDNSTSVLGPSTVATVRPSTVVTVGLSTVATVAPQPLLENCPSLRATPGLHAPLRSPTLQLTSCESVRLTPLTTPASLQQCESVRLTPLPSLRPMPPLLLTSPSLHHHSLPLPRQQDVRLLLLSGNPCLPESSSAAVTPLASPAGATMLRLPPPLQPPKLQHSPCSISRDAFPRANTLAPLTHGSVPSADNTVALNRLTSLQAAFRERQQLQPQLQAESSCAGWLSEDGGSCSRSASGEMSSVVASLKFMPLLGENQERQEQQEQLHSDRIVSLGSTTATCGAKTRAKATESGGGAANRGHGPDYEDEYDNNSFCDDDDDDNLVDRDVMPILGGLLSHRSSAPAAIQGSGGRVMEPMRRMDSIRDEVDTGVRQRSGTAATIAATCIAAPALSAPQNSGHVETAMKGHTAHWLDELLPMFAESSEPQRPIGRSGPSVPSCGAHPKRGGLPVVDSFKRLMREIE